MGIRLLVFVVLLAVVILVIAIRLAMLVGQDRRRLYRAIMLLGKGTLPSKIEERLVAEGLDRTTAAEVVASALKAYARASTPKIRPDPRVDAAAPVRLEDFATADRKTVAPDSTSEPLLSTPHERGVALLYQRGDYVGALEAFTQAIEQDPLFPNAYLGRALAHRRLGDFAAALEDERKAEDLGGAEKTPWGRLVNRAWHRLHGDLSNPIW